MKSLLTIVFALAGLLASTALRVDGGEKSTFSDKDRAAIQECMLLHVEKYFENFLY